MVIVVRIHTYGSTTLRRIERGGNTTVELVAARDDESYEALGMMNLLAEFRAGFESYRDNLTAVSMSITGPDSPPLSYLGT